MNSIVNVKTSVNLVEASDRYERMAEELRDKGYIREAQNVKKASIVLNRAGVKLFDRYEPEYEKKKRQAERKAKRKIIVEKVSSEDATTH